MKSKLILAFATLLLCSFGNAQSYFAPSELANQQPDETFELFNESDTRNADLPSELKSYTLLNLQKSVLSTLMQVRDGDVISLSIPFPDGRKRTVVLKETVLFTENVVTLPDRKQVELSKGKHYRGILEGAPNTVVAISLSGEEVSGIISDPDMGNLVLGRLEDRAEHIIYNDFDIRDKHSLSCATPNDFTPYTVEELKYVTHTRSVSENCIELYIEVDHDIFKKRGSLVNTTNFIEGILNQVATLYAAEDINITFAPLHIWTKPSPYNAKTTTGILSQFQLLSKNWQGDLAGLLSFKSQGGIAAGFNGLCATNPKNSMSFSSISNSYNTVPAYSWSVDVVAHEFGHLLGSRHTHACVWNGDGTAIDGCSGYTEGSCGVPENMSGAGTIMSYCHMSPGGKNLSLGFGDQPGNVIRNKIINAACLETCEGVEPDTCHLNNFSITLHTDRYGNETSWQLKDSSQTIIGSGSQYDRLTTYTQESCLPAGCYTFTIYDSYGDGMCCNYGDGYFRLQNNGKIIATGGDFGDSTVIQFCLDDNYSDIDSIAPASTVMLLEDVSYYTALVSWSHVPDEDTISYKVYINDEFYGVTQDSFMALSALEESTEYEVYTIAIDQSMNLSVPSNTLYFETLTPLLPDYCDLASKVDSYEWISGIKINGQRFDNGQLNAELIDVNSPVERLFINLEVQAGFSNTAYKENWYVWVDLDHNGELEDDELILEGKTYNKNYKSFPIHLPKDVEPGTTLMRVAMKYNANDASCGVFNYGDVADFAIIIDDTYGSTMTADMGGIKVYPTLITDRYLTVDMPEKTKYTYYLIDASGRSVQSDQLEKQRSIIYFNEAYTGIYYLQIVTNEQVYTEKLVVK